MEWPDKTRYPENNVKVLGIEAEGTDDGAVKRYALDYDPWENWLGMEIDADTRKRFTDAEIIAACLWEMTFFAFDPTAPLRALERMKRTMDEIDDMSWEMLEKHSTKIGEVKGCEVRILNSVIDELERKGK